MSSLSSLGPGTIKMTESIKMSNAAHDHYGHQGVMDSRHGMGFGWLGILFMWLIVFILFFWVVLYSLNPRFVQNPDDGAVDTARVLLWAFIFAVILMIIIWIIRLIANRSRQC